MGRINSFNPPNFRTICEVHREIYDIICEINDDDTKNLLQEKVEEAFNMAKKMDAKLRQYKFNYDDEWWQKESQEIKKQKGELRLERLENIKRRKDK